MNQLSAIDRRRRNLRTLLVAIILGTLPFYCAGIVLYLTAPRTSAIPQTSLTPSGNATNTPLEAASITPPGFNPTNTPLGLATFPQNPPTASFPTAIFPTAVFPTAYVPPPTDFIFPTLTPAPSLTSIPTWTPMPSETPIPTWTWTPTPTMTMTDFVVDTPIPFIEDTPLPP